MKDTITTQVRLKSFKGEGLWVTAVSYYSCSFLDNKLHKLRLYDTPEFFPNIPNTLKDDMYYRYNHYPKLFYLYLYEGLKALVNQLIYNSTNYFGEAVFDRVFSRRCWWDDIHYRINKALSKDWFYCVDVYQATFHIEGNIELVEDLGNSYWDEIYLTPTDKWIEERLAEGELSALNKDEWGEKTITHSREDFTKWEEEQNAKGLYITYITSLET